MVGRHMGDKGKEANLLLGDGQKEGDRRRSKKGHRHEDVIAGYLLC